MLMACYQGGLACCVYMITDTNFRAVCVCVCVFANSVCMLMCVLSPCVDFVVCTVDLMK